MILRDFDDDHDADDWEDDDPVDSDLDECPRCSKNLYDDSERCPHCGHYLSLEDQPRRKPWWVMVGVIGCLLMVSWWILDFF